MRPVNPEWASSRQPDEIKEGAETLRILANAAEFALLLNGHKTKTLQYAQRSKFSAKTSMSGNKPQRNSRATSQPAMRASEALVAGLEATI